MKISSRGILDLINTSNIRQNTKINSVRGEIFCWIQNKYIFLSKCNECKYTCNEYKIMKNGGR